MARWNPCGVCTRRSSSRTSAPETMPSGPTTTVVSMTGRTGTTALAPSARAASTRSTTSGGVSGRAASWTRTTSASSPAAARPARTDAVRVAPPSTRRTSPPSTAAKASRSPAGTVTRTSATPPARSVSTAQQTSGRPASGTSAFGRSAPRRRPLPAAATMPTACTGVIRVEQERSSAGEDLVEEDLRLVLVGALGERELADEDLAGLREHPLLAGREAAVLVAAPEVAHDLGHLVHVTGGQLLEVGLVAARPVGRFLGVRGAQNLEDLVQAFLTDDVTHADDLRVVSRHTHRQVALGDLQHEVGLLDALDGPLLDRLDECGTVVRIDDSLADSEAHVDVTPFAISRLPRQTDERIHHRS